jgi:hypothetical protein
VVPTTHFLAIVPPSCGYRGSTSPGKVVGGVRPPLLWQRPRNSEVTRYDRLTVRERVPEEGRDPIRPHPRPKEPLCGRGRFLPGLSPAIAKCVSPCIGGALTAIPAGQFRYVEKSPGRVVSAMWRNTASYGAVLRHLAKNYVTKRPTHPPGGTTGTMGPLPWGPGGPEDRTGGRPPGSPPFFSGSGALPVEWGGSQ